MNPWDSLRLAARAAQAHSYSPYSHFAVGCALETTDGLIFTGTNVENASYGGTICAERVAVTKAISEGHRRFRRLVVVTDSELPTPPCGFCRQFLSEFCPGEVEIVLYGANDAERHFTMGELLPYPFTPAFLEDPANS